MSAVDEVPEYMQSLGVRARAASQLIASADGQTKNKALNAIANALQESQATLVAANQKDMEAGAASGLAEALLDRLELTPARLPQMQQHFVSKLATQQYCAVVQKRLTQTNLWLPVLNTGLILQACRLMLCNL